MFPSRGMVPSCKTSDALLLQECNKYTGWIRLRIHAGYKCDSKWLSMITIRQDRRKYSLLVVIVRIELLSSYLYFPNVFPRRGEGRSHSLCMCVRVYLKCESGFVGLPGFCMGRHAEKCRRGLRGVMHNDAVGMLVATWRCWAHWMCTAHSVKAYVSSGLPGIWSSAWHRKLSDIHIVKLWVCFIYPRQIFPSPKGKFFYGNPYLWWF